MQSHRSENKDFLLPILEGWTYLPSILCRFVCLINFFTPFTSILFKSKHRIRLLGPRQRFSNYFQSNWTRNEKKIYIGYTFLNSTTYLAFHVGLCVWSTLCPPSHQAISNLSTDLESLGQGKGFKTICKVMEPEMKKKYHWRHFFWPHSHQDISYLSTDLDFLG